MLVGEIDTRVRFHQHFTQTFFWQYPFAKKLQSQTVVREKMSNLL